MNDLVSAIASNFVEQPVLKKQGVYRSSTKAFIISMINDHSSTVALRKCLLSIKSTGSHINPFIMDATTPLNLQEHLKTFNLTVDNWTYPKSPAEQKTDINSGLVLTGYRTNDLHKVISCLVSHMRLWRLCTELNENIIILEHDAIFTKKFKIEDLKESFTGGVLGLNSPLGATRRAKVYDREVKINTIEQHKIICDAPWIDKKHIPQGIAGNSAYLIKPEAADHLLKKIEKVGMWPNDALMCKQFFPWLQQVYPYYTTVQGTKSSTTL